MNKKQSISAAAITVAASLCTAAAAQAATNSYDGVGNDWYVGGAGDVTWPDHAGTGGGGKIDLGYRWGTTTTGSFRLEAEGGYHAASGEDGRGEIRYANYMGNAYYDFFNLTQNYSSVRVTPYIGGGVGEAEIHRGQGDFTGTLSHHTDAFAYQGMAGLSFAVAQMPRTEMTVGYRYVGAEREDGIKLDANNLELGLRYNF